ncbi:MAG: AMP-binding protein [Pseudomonadota bacterium]
MGDPIKRIERKSRRTIFRSFLATARRKGGKALAAIDGDGRKLTYSEMARGAFGLSGPLSRRLSPGETVGILLPTGVGAPIAMFALHACGCTPAMLNFTAGVRNLKSAARTSQVTKVITAHKFIDIANLGDLVDGLSDELEFIYLEDVKEEVTSVDKAKALLGPMLPELFLKRAHPDATGVILFTSGTEGNPKGVALSHANILSNIEQIAEHVEIAPTDVFFNPLPTFHCYGLTAGTLWPMIVGYPVVLHPSPLQTKIIPKRIFESGSTVLFATDTFLQQYMRASSDGGMTSLRLAVCGAERVKDETRQMAERRFSFEVLEGYGVTEGSPVLAANQPGDIRSGTVGKMLPGVDVRLEPVEGMEGAGRLFVRGPNIMKGYLRANAPGEIRPLEEGWHDTGDVVSLDKDGYLAIRGRMKRFAKIGGEMVSLAVVENCATAVWPDHMHAAAILPDKRKGEQIVLVTDRQEPDRGLLLAWAQSHGVPEIAVPKKIVSVAEVPVLGTGKLDYVNVERLAKEGVEAAAQPAPEAEPTKKELKDAKKRQRAEERAAAKEAQREAKAKAKADPGKAAGANENPAKEAVKEEGYSPSDATDEAERATKKAADKNTAGSKAGDKAGDNAGASGRDPAANAPANDDVPLPKAAE